MKILLVCEADVENAGEMSALLDRFREATQPSAEYGLILSQATPEDVGEIALAPGGRIHVITKALNPDAGDISDNVPQEFTILHQGGIRVILGKEPGPTQDGFGDVLVERHTDNKFMVSIHPDEGDPFCHVLLHDNKHIRIEDSTGSLIHEEYRD